MWHLQSVHIPVVAVEEIGRPSACTAHANAPLVGAPSTKEIYPPHVDPGGEVIIQLIQLRQLRLREGVPWCQRFPGQCVEVEGMYHVPGHVASLEEKHLVVDHVSFGAY